MKQLHILIWLLIATAGAAFAQTTPTLAKDYFFKTSTGVRMEDMTTAIVLVGPSRADELVTDQTEIGFNFEFAGKPFNAFQAFSSGAFLLTNMGSQASSNLQVLFPWADALFTGDNGHISYKVVGETNRKMVVEFFMSRYVANSSFAALADKKFQVWLYENSNKVEFVYGEGTVVDAQAIVGIAHTESPADLYQVNTDLHEISTASFYESNTWPGAGRAYVFSPTNFVAAIPEAQIVTTGNTEICEGGMVHFAAQLPEATATTYQWLRNGESIEGAISADYNATATGDYSVQIGYADGNVTSTSVAVFVSSLHASVEATNITCGTGINGTIIIKNATGGNGDFEYSIGNNVWQQDAAFGGLVAGTYAVKMRVGTCEKMLGNYNISDLSAVPVASIVVGKVTGCSNVSLTAFPDDAVSYTWSNGETGKTIILDQADADGKYSVNVSNGGGCVGTASYTYNKQNQLSSYAILALSGALIGENNIVNGSIGTKGNIGLYISRNTTVNGFVRSAVTRTGQPVTVTGGINNSAATVALPTVYSNTSVIKNLPTKTVSDNVVVTLSGNYNDLVVGKKAKVILHGNVFGKITIKSGGRVTFTGKDVSINDLELQDGIKKINEEANTEVNFAAGTLIRVKNKVLLGNNNRVNAGGSTFYMVDVRDDEEKFIVDGGNTVVSANVLMPKGILGVRGADATNRCTLNGAFIAEYIISDKYVTWNGNQCNTFAPRANPVFVNADAKLKLSVYPNPGNGMYRLTISNNGISRADVVVTALNGTVIKKETFTNIQAGRAVGINLLQQPAGMYLVKVITAKGVQTIKVIKK